MRLGFVIAAAVVGLVLVVAAGGLVLATRPGVSVGSQVDPDVTVECAAGTGLDEGGCRAWGDAQLALGGPSTTFEMDDLARLRLERSLFGLGGECSAIYSIERYPDEPVWTEAVACP